MSVGFSQPIIESIFTAPAVSRELKTAGLGQVARPVNRSGYHRRRQNIGAELEQQHGQGDWGQQGVIMPGSPEAWS